MISLIRDWLINKKKTQVESIPNAITNYSLTSTSATEGSNSKHEFSPEITSILAKINSNNNITNIELNELNAFYFNKPPIPSGVFSINKDLAASMLFEIKRIDTVNDSNGDVANIVIGLTEITLGNEMSMSISINDFHEIFQHFQFKQEKT